MVLYYITDRIQFPGDERARRRALLDKIAEAARAGVDYIQLREKDLSTCELEKLAREAVAVVRENGAGFRNALELEASDPQGLKPSSFAAFNGTAEAEPHPKSNDGVSPDLLRTENRELGTGLTATSAQRTAARLLINSRTDVALAAGADGVHLRSYDVSASLVRSVWKEAVARCLQPAARSPFVAVSCHSLAEVLSAESERADLAVFAPVFEKKDAPATKPQGLDALHEACTAKIPVLALGGVTLENAAQCLDAGAAGIAAIRLFQENKIEDVVRALRAL